MAAVTYVGPVAAAASDVATRAYISALTAANLPQSTVDSMMAAGFAPYVLKSYVDAQDAKNATKSYIDTGDGTRLHTSQRNVNNGIAGLDATGRVPIGRVNVASTQRWLKPFVSPAAYNATNISATTTETTVYPITVADPGTTYRLFVTGTVDTSSTADGEYALIQARVGNATTGQIIGVGRGLPESYSVLNESVDGFEYTANNLNTSDWSLSNGAGSGGGVAELAADGHNAYLRQITGGSQLRRARRINTGDQVTPTDYQEITAVLATGQANTLDLNEFFLRVNTAFTVYVKLRIYCSFTGSTSAAEWTYATGFGESSTQASASGITVAPSDTWKVIAGANGNTRKYDLLRNGTSVSSWTDSFNVSNVGSVQRGWGFGMGNVFGTYGQAKLASISISDGTRTYARGPAVIVPSAFESQTPLTGGTTVYVTITRSGSTSTQSAYTTSPSFYVMAVPA